MILINPRGEEVEFGDDAGKKFLSIPLKIKQGWKEKKIEKPQTPKKKAVKQTSKKKVND